MNDLISIGIDLGTTHTALAVARTDEQNHITSEVVALPQLVNPTAVQSRALLPSFVYFAHASEGSLGLPWDPERTHAVGELARARSVEAPGRVVSSAKSWLSHAGIDRRRDLLPLAAAEDIEKISPVEATFRVLDHVAEAWARAQVPGSETSLSDLDVVLTVPASFDAAARDLTVEAALAAGIEQITLLEEPQAALYAWIERVGSGFRKYLVPGDVVLVVDVGGGTTDFSAIEAIENDGALELRRIAVGDHILLGGDNMDLALAHHLKQKLESNGAPLDRWQMHALVHAARQAKENLLSSNAFSSIPVAVASRGSELLGSTRRTELLHDEVQQLLVDGYFPIVPASARPSVRPRTALQQLGLPYASDPAVTKHLAAFLSKQARAVKNGEKPILCPTRILFNGGVLKSTVFRDRLLGTLNSWLREVGAPEASVLPGEDLDLAVARGAAYFGEVRRGNGLRIRGGTGRAYYIGIESPMPAVPGVEPPIYALCVAPVGLEEGSAAVPIDQELLAVVGEPVRFRFFGSTVRRDDKTGQLLEAFTEQELEELSPIEVTLPAEGRTEGDAVPVKLTASVTAIGTLLIEAIPIEPQKPDERWKVELSVREQAPE
ncbi:MAG TPA: Hsp70 family protein [Polyangiaceae bacterium]|nr:Hsp70 family protein [Polyangiaceae bacterium]